MGKRLIALFMALLVPVSSFAINLDGAILEKSAPDTVRGREMTTLHGGGIRFRIQDQTFRPFSVIPPSVRSGCGGIDATFGAFSYFNMEYLGQFLQNLMQGVPVVFFNLALHTFCPQCQQLFQQLASLANQINQIGVSKCGAISLATQLGKHMIDDAMDRRINESGEYVFGKRDPAHFFDGYMKKFGTYMETFAEKLEQYCPGGDCLMGLLLNINKQPTSLLQRAREKGDIPPGVFALFRKQDGRQLEGEKLEEVLRGILGDVALFPPQKQDSNRVKGYYIQVYSGFLFESPIYELIGDSCFPDEVVQVDTVRFTGNRGNPFVRGETLTIRTLCGRIAEHTRNIKNKIISRQALSSEELSLLASMPAPVLYLLNAGSVEPGLLDVIFQKIDRYMASELLLVALNKVQEKYSRYLTACVSDVKDRVDEGTRRQCEFALESLGEISRTLFKVRMEYYKELTNSLQSAEVAYSVHTRIMAQMAGTPLYGTLMFSRMLSTAGGGR